VPRPHPWLRWISIAAVIATYLLIVVGGVVRTTGSGLGCPDWPLCYGQPVPPAQPSSVIEYSHRAFGGVASALIVATMLLWARARAWDWRVVAIGAAIGGLLAGQIVLGAVTVALELPPMIVLAHLGLAMALLGSLIVVAVHIWRGTENPAQMARPGSTRQLRRTALGSAAAVYVLVLTGAFVRATGASWACVGWPGCNGQALPFGADRLVDIQLSHRLLAYAVCLFVGYVAWRVWRSERSVPGLAPAALAIAVSILAQIAIGATMVSTGVAPAAQLLHVGGAAALWSSTVALAALAWRPARTPLLAVAIAAGLGRSTAPLQTAERGGDRTSLARTVAAYVSLTKPRVISLLLLTTLAAMVIAARGLPPVHLILLTLLGGALGAGGANAINCWLDRDIDAVMQRTVWRAIPAGVLQPRDALIFGVLLGVASFVLLAALVNVLSAVLTTAALLFYVLVYTSWLKRSSAQNIVIGGAAGAVPPLVGWAAVTGEISLLAVYLFAIVFYWTPPHFWALSLLIKEDYRRAGVPMLPVVRGEEETRRQILLYAVALVALTVVVFAAGLLGVPYLVGAVVLGAILILYAFRLLREGTRDAARRMFKYSMLYLALLFVVMAIDRVVTPTL
jgi:protoheme IX farnesyltransferase